MVTHPRLERGTPWLRVRCSTNWANESCGWDSRTRTCEMTESKSVALPTWLYPIMAYLQGFEPRTHGLEGHCSISWAIGTYYISPQFLILYNYYTYNCILGNNQVFYERNKNLYGAGEGNRTSQSAWKAEVLPLNYTRKWWREKDLNLRSLWQQIYSLPPLTNSGTPPF